MIPQNSSGLKLIPPGRHPGVKADAKPGDTDNPSIKGELHAIINPGKALGPMDSPIPADEREALIEERQAAAAPAVPERPKTSSETLKRLQAEGTPRNENVADDPMHQLFGSAYDELLRQGSIQDTALSRFIASIVTDQANLIDPVLKDDLDEWMKTAMIDLNTANSVFVDMGAALDQYGTDTFFNFKNWQEFAIKSVTLKTLGSLLTILGLDDYKHVIMLSEVDKQFGRSLQLEAEAKEKDQNHRSMVDNIIQHLSALIEVTSRANKATVLQQQKNSSPFHKKDATVLKPAQP